MRDALRGCGAQLICTSATLDAEKFSTYFNSCPIFTIRGRTFPVEVPLRAVPMGHPRWYPESTLRVPMCTPVSPMSTRSFRVDVAADPNAAYARARTHALAPTRARTPTHARTCTGALARTRAL